ncbi:MAG: transporter substrate-binding domain-containing protein [Myxococcales bacterium]|nr:transporter substrate-binding domain-containing protein [Myxococcales bacterium]USN50379.1 MAG: transporter substrate-binding domain-containing protein [Myxococcales bacterium]
MRVLKYLFLLLCCGSVAHGELLDHGKVKLSGGWYWWDPYQYLAKPKDESSLVGLDIQITKKVFEEADMQPELKPIPWHDHIERIKNGEVDYAAGATYTEERAEFAYYSIPYRYEENSLFVRRSDQDKFDFSDVNELIKYIEKNSVKIGVVRGFVYGNKIINEWIKRNVETGLVIFSTNDNENVEKLNQKKIDGFFADRISGSTAIWRMSLGSKFTEIELGIKTPVYFIFSKKVVNIDIVNSVNIAINKLVSSGEMAKIVEFYFYPVVLLQTVDTIWFRLFEFIGALGMAVSGLVIAYRDRATIFGTAMLAVLPSLGGSVVRDLVFDRFPVRAMANPSNFIMVLCVIVIAFFFVRIMERLQWPVFSHLGRQNWLVHVLAFSEALGLAAFTISGIVVSVVAKVNPLWLWGPFFALVTGTGGGILRDIIGKNREIMALRGGILPEIAIFWGLLLSLFLINQSHAAQTRFIKYALVITAIGIFATRSVIYFFKIPNIYLRKDKSAEAEVS